MQKPWCGALLPLVLLAALIAACSSEKGESRPNASSPPDAGAPSVSGLWAGSNSPSEWFTIRVTTGSHLDNDPWQFDLGGDVVGSNVIVGSGVGGFVVTCRPDRRSDGWHFEQCENLPDDLQFQAFCPLDGSSGLKVQLASPDGRSTAVLNKVGTRDEPQASPNVSLLWHHAIADDDMITDIWAADGLVYVPHWDGTIEILEAGSARKVGTIDVAVAPRRAGNEESAVLNVKIHDGHLYAATTNRGLVIFDISNPARPRFVGQHFVFNQRPSPENFFNVHNIYLSPRGDILYAMNQSHQRTDLRLIDISNPNAPKEAGRFIAPDPNSIVHEINVIERQGRLVAFLNYLGAGLYILDVTSPRALQVLSEVHWNGTFSHSGWPFLLEDRLYYAHTDEGYDQGLTVLEVADYRAPRVVGRFKSREGISIHNIEVVDGIGYVSYYIDGLRVIDLRDPTNPREIGHFDTVPPDAEIDILQGAWGVHVADGRVYLSDMQAGAFAFTVAIPR